MRGIICSRRAFIPEVSSGDQLIQLHMAHGSAVVQIERVVLDTMY